MLRIAWLALALPIVPLFGQVPTAANQVWIADIQANPARFWNTTVTIVGQVQDVNANPPGTTRGTYTIMDDSSQQPLIIRTRDLPPVGREYAVTGVIIQDPAQVNVPILNETGRAEPGMSATMRYLLIGGAVLFAGLLVLFVVLLMRPRPAPAPIPAPGSGPRGPTPEPASFEPTRRDPALDVTRKVPDTAADPDRTKVFMSLGAEIVVEKGPDTGAVFPLHKPVTSIGRPGARKNDIELSDDTVSKEQASIFYDSKADQFTVANHSTTNPTAVNEQLVTQQIELEPEATIQMGSTVLRFRKQ